MNILVLNCGGATLKYKLFDMPAETVRAQGLADRLGTERATFTHTVPGREPLVLQRPLPDHLTGIRLLLETLVDPSHGVLATLDEIDAVAHKLAHGGEKITGAVRITDEVIAAMEEMVPLVPLHNPPNLTGIAVVRELLPDTPQYGTFETSFHHTVPSHAWIYGLPYAWYEDHHVRSYGFHSASHRYVAQRAAELVGRPVEDLRTISCHLGSGTSVCAIRGGQSQDISSGLTPQSGTMMSTRPGDFDPFVILYVMDRLGLDTREMNRLLTKESGLLGISGVSGDLRDLEAAADAGVARAQLALDAFVYHVRRYVGSYLLELGGVDILSFTGGIGENSPRIRAAVCRDLDPQRNEQRGQEGIISAEGQPAQIVVVRTDEELIVARDALRLLETVTEPPPP
jgi:acetate kinase